MGMTRERSRAFSTLRPLAAAIALSGISIGSHAVTVVPPGVMQSSQGALREDGSRLRTSLHAWHADAFQNAIPASVHSTTRLVTNCSDDGDGSLRAVITASASGDTVDLSHLSGKAYGFRLTFAQSGRGAKARGCGALRPFPWPAHLVPRGWAPSEPVVNPWGLSVVQATAPPP